MKKLTILFVLFTSFCTGVANASASGFFDEQNQYKGFYWFESLKQKNRKVDQKEDYQIPSPSTAAALVEARKRELDDARNQMLAVGFDDAAPLHVLREAIVKYRKLEENSLSGAIRMSQNSEMANFLNPGLTDNIRQPTNVHGIKLQKRLVDEENKTSIRKFANDFDLLLFAEDSCLYCREFKPVINSFANNHGFKLEVTSLNSPAGKIANQLGIKAVPTLVAVKKDSTQAFEVSRGMVSLTELESNIILAQKYSSEQKLITKNNKNKFKLGK